MKTPLCQNCRRKYPVVYQRRLLCGYCIAAIEAEKAAARAEKQQAKEREQRSRRLAEAVRRDSTAWKKVYRVNTDG